MNKTEITLQYQINTEIQGIRYQNKTILLFLPLTHQKVNQETSSICVQVGSLTALYSRCTLSRQNEPNARQMHSIPCSYLLLNTYRILKSCLERHLIPRQACACPVILLGTEHFD